jgi:ABC-type Zn uptake system ZnuABC Zn-binding protein ZnuA
MILGNIAGSKSRRLCSAAAAAIVAIIAAAGCGNPAKDSSAYSSRGDELRLKVVVTFSTLGAIVKDVGGDRIDVTSLVPVGAAPETYEPTPADLIALSHADIIFENGSGLEAWMDKLLRSAGGDKTPIELSGKSSRYYVPNPHLWLAPYFAASYAQDIEQALEHADMDNAPVYRSRLKQTLARYRTLDHWIASKVATIPPDRRAMICFHDAWYYFDSRYGIKDVGAIEPSPGQEPSAGAFAQLIAAAKANHVHAIFAEPQFSPKLARQLAEGAGITTVTDLYDDTLGPTPALSTYDGLMRYDVERIVEALRT